MRQPPAYYRARLSAIAQAIDLADEKQVKLLQNGYAPDLTVADISGFDNSPLSFLELTSWDTWFTMYPDKVCGKTVTTTSRSFPLAVKGNKNDVVRIISGHIEKKTEGETGIRIRIAKAKLKILNLNF